MNNEKEQTMNYFFNDVKVTEAEYHKLIEDAESHHQLLADAKAKQVAADKELAKSKPKAKSRKVAKMPAPVDLNKVTIKGVADKVAAPKKGSKTAVAAECMAKVGVENKVGCVEAIMVALGVTKGNATCYYFNVMKKGLI